MQLWGECVSPNLHHPKFIRSILAHYAINMLLPVTCSYPRSQIEELTLKSNSTTELKILFEEPWLVQTSHSRLRGDLPLDRDWNTASLLGSE